MESRATEVRKAVSLYRDMGLLPFPVCTPLGSGCKQHQDCDKPGKRPLLNSWTKLNAGSPHEAAVNDRFEHFDWDCNIGLRTGLEANLLVLDIDGPKGSASLEGYELPAGPVITTGRIGGYHHWFLAPEEEIAKKIAFLPGVDLMAEGGFVLAPPSVHASGNVYRAQGSSLQAPLPELPSWIFDIAPGPSSQSVALDPSLVHLGKRAQAFLSNGCIEAQREEALNAVVNMLGQRVERDTVVDLVADVLMNHCPQTGSKPWKLRDVEIMVDSIVNKGGPKPARALDSAPELVLGSNDASSSGSLSESREAEGSVNSKTRKAKGLVAIMRAMQESPLDEPLIEGIINRGEFLWFFAPPNSGKTFVAMDWAMHIASGRTYQVMHQVSRGKVLLIEQDRRSDPPAYLEAHLENGHWDLEELEENLLMAEESDFDLRSQDGMVKLLSYIDSESPDLVIMDSCAQFCANGITDVDYVWIQKFKENMKARSIACIMLDHTVANPEFSGDEANKKTDLDKLYGGQAKRKILDTGLYMQGYLKTGQVELRWAKVQGRDKEPMILSYTPRVGFELRLRFDPSKHAWTQTEIKVCEALTRGRMSIKQLAEASNLSERTLYQNLPTMVHRQQVVRSGGSSGRGNAGIYGIGPKASSAPTLTVSGPF